MSINANNLCISQIISCRISNLCWISFSPQEWLEITQKAQQESVVPLLFQSISGLESYSSFPPEMQKSLRKEFTDTWSTNQKRLRQIEILAQKCSAAKIPIVVLKGMCFALTLYSDLGFRPMGDIDLLVPEAKLNTAVQLAESIGFEDFLPEASPGLNSLIGHHVCMCKRGSPPIFLELHKSLVADRSFSYAVPVDWFWTQTEKLEYAFHAPHDNLFMLTPTAQLLFAAAHAMLQHGGEQARLIWFYDMDQIIRQYDTRIDWNLLVAQATLFNWGSALKAALEQTNVYFDTPVPQEVQVNLAQQTDKHANVVIQKQTRPATIFLEEVQSLRSLNAYARARVIIALVFPTPAYMRGRYRLKSSWQVPGYYFIRWWGILKNIYETARIQFNKQSVAKIQPVQEIYSEMRGK